MDFAYQMTYGVSNPDFFPFTTKILADYQIFLKYILFNIYLLYS